MPKGVASSIRAGGLEPKPWRNRRAALTSSPRLKGATAQPPLLLNAHLDAWSRPRQELEASIQSGAEIHDGYVWLAGDRHEAPLAGFK
jgi:hypothetical protein